MKTSEVRPNPFKNLWYSVLEENPIQDYYFRNIEYFNNDSNSKDLKYKVFWKIFRVIDRQLNKPY